MDLGELTKLAIKAAVEAGELIRSYHDREVEVLHKKGGDTYASQVVTEVDRKALRWQLAQAIEKRLAFAELGTDERIPGLAREICRHLAHNAKKFAHLPQALRELGFSGRNRAFVLGVLVLELLAGGFLACQRSLGLGEQAFLLIVVFPEFLLALLVLFALGLETFANHLKQFVEGHGFRGRRSRR